MTLAPWESLTQIDPFHDRPAERELYEPLSGESMLELGNKRNRDRTYKAFFEAMGFRHVSVDQNGQDGALVLDLCQPLKLGQFDVVTNIGTSEHVSYQPGCWRNIVEAMPVGGLLISTTPMPGDWNWHGYHYPTEEFYRELADGNGLGIERLYVSGEAPRRMWFARMTRNVDVPFKMPAEQLLYHNNRTHVR